MEHERINEKRMAQVFGDLEMEIKDHAAVIATSYAKAGTREVGRQWAAELKRRFELGVTKPGLTDATKQNRRSRGVEAFLPNTPLYETGRLLEFVEFRHTTIPERNYDILEIGIFDESTQIGHTWDITPKRLAMINEYGFKGTFKRSDGGSIEIDIPERPIFAETALQMGHTFNRIFKSQSKKARIAMDWSPGAKHGDPFSAVGKASSKSRRRKRGSVQRKTVIGKYRKNGSGILVFKWEDED